MIRQARLRLFIAIALIANAAWAGDVEDGDAALQRNDYST